jgi:DNA polymerase elongation subunit (family B)
MEEQAHAPAHAYPPPAFPEPDAGIAFRVPSLTYNGENLHMCVFTIDIRTGLPRTYDAAGFCDDAVLSYTDAMADEAAAAFGNSDDTDDDAENTSTPHKPHGGFVLPDPRAPAFAYVTGHTAAGAKVGLRVPWRPACQVEVCRVNDSVANQTKARNALNASLLELEKQLRVAYADGTTANKAWGCHLHAEWHEAARFNGYVPTAGAPLTRQQYVYAEVSAPNAAVLRWVAGSLRRGAPPRGGFPGRQSFPVHEDGIDAEQAFVDAHGIQPCGWVAVAASALTPARDAARELAVHYEFTLAAPPLQRRPSWFAAATRWRQFTQLPHITAVPSMVMACIDGEMTSGAPGRFPRAARPDNAVVVTSVILSYTGGSVPGRPAGAVFERHAFVWGPHADFGAVDPIPGVITHTGFSSEGAALAAVRDLLFVHRCVDIVAGHNIVKFDVAYMAARAARKPAGFSASPPGARFSRFGVLVREQLTLREKRLTSSAFGANNLRLLPGAGFAYVDTMLLCKVHPKKLRENTLAAAAEAFLAPGDAAAAWAALAGYCVQDSELVHKLLVAWDTTRDLVAQSRTINIPLAANVLCGQQQRVRDSLMLKARASAMVMNGVNVQRARFGTAHGGSGANNEPGADAAPPITATGGFVLDNVAGFHDAPVVVLDFASLYPSVQRSRNLCWSTVIDDATWNALSDADRRALGIETHETATGVFRFATNVEGVFPAQLGDLLAARTAAKRDMAAAKQAKDAAAAAMAAAKVAGNDAALTAATEAYNVAAAAYLNADARQKATKIVMNSGYGTANAAEGTGVMPCRALGTTTCWVGAQLNRAAKAHVESKFGAVVLYGDTDSIMVVFPRKNAAAEADADRYTILMDAFDQADEAEASLNELFGEAEARHAAAKAEALAAAKAGAGSGKPAAEEAEPPKKTGQIVQTEAEKIYYPWASLGKKVYTGVKYEHRPKGDVPRDLSNTGSIEAKGMKMVRRDVPVFTRRLTEALLDAMLRKRNNAAFWGVVHDFVYTVCLGPREHGGGPGALPLSDFTITRELKEGFETQKPLGPQGAVAYAAEWVRRGACPALGDRVAYAFVTRPDVRRLQRPPWMPSVAPCVIPGCVSLATWAARATTDVSIISKCVPTLCAAHVPPEDGFRPQTNRTNKCIECGGAGAWIKGTSFTAVIYCSEHVPKDPKWGVCINNDADGDADGDAYGDGDDTKGSVEKHKLSGTTKPAFGCINAGGGTALRSAYARSAAEIAAHPDDNVLDIVYYVEKCVATVIEQLRPDAAAKPSIAAAIAFAKQVASQADCLRGPSAAVTAMWASFGDTTTSAVDFAAAETAAFAFVDMPGVVAAVRKRQPLRVLPGSEPPRVVIGGADGAAAVHKKTASDVRKEKAAKEAETKRQASALGAFFKSSVPK